MKKVSVIIPNYNGMQYVKRCLDSLMAQTLKDWEILFIDNGSADGSRELVEKEYPLVKVIALPENLGFCGAVNIGIRAATASYVVLLNNDTEAEPEFLQELYDGIRRKPRAFSGGAMMLQFHDRKKLMMQEISTMHLDGHLHWEKESLPQTTTKKEKYFPPVGEQRSTEKTCWKNWDILTKNISPIWKIWISDTVPR